MRWIVIMKHGTCVLAQPTNGMKLFRGMPCRRPSEAALGQQEQQEQPRCRLWCQRSRRWWRRHAAVLCTPRVRSLLRALALCNLLYSPTLCCAESSREERVATGAAPRYRWLRCAHGAGAVGCLAGTRAAFAMQRVRSKLPLSPRQTRTVVRRVRVCEVSAKIEQAQRSGAH